MKNTELREIFIERIDSGGYAFGVTLKATNSNRLIYPDAEFCSTTKIVIDKVKKALGVK